MTLTRVEWMTGIILFIVSILFYPQIQRLYYDFLPAHEFMEIRKLSVSSGGLKEIVVVYDRVIKKEFDGTYTVSVLRVNQDGNQFPVCSGSKDLRYEPKESIVTVPLERFIGGKCELLPGTYILVVVWVINRDGGYHEKIVRITSNPFEVRDVGYKS